MIGATYRRLSGNVLCSCGAQAVFSTVHREKHIAAGRWCLWYTKIKCESCHKWVVGKSSAGPDGAVTDALAQWQGEQEVKNGD